MAEVPLALSPSPPQTTFGAFQVLAPGLGHGPMHVNLGGVWGGCTDAMKAFYERNAEELDKPLTDLKAQRLVAEKTGTDPFWLSRGVDGTYDDDRLFGNWTLRDIVRGFVHEEYYHFYRMLWRSQTCALDGAPHALRCSCAGPNDCSCMCDGADDPATFNWTNIEPCIYEGGGTPFKDQVVKKVMSEAARRDLVTTVCTASAYEGELLESASPSDPIFWMIHPAIDRMLSAKRLAGYVSYVSNCSNGIRISPLKYCE